MALDKQQLSKLYCLALDIVVGIEPTLSQRSILTATDVAGQDTRSLDFAYPLSHTMFGRKWAIWLRVCLHQEAIA